MFTSLYQALITRRDSLLLQAECLRYTSRNVESGAATIEEPSSHASPLLIESASRPSELLLQNSVEAVESVSDVVTLSESDSIVMAVESTSELEGAFRTTTELIRTLTLGNESDDIQSPPMTATECRELVLTYAAAALPSESLRYWSWSDVAVHPQPKAEVIYFVDDFEREFSLPWSEAKTWIVCIPIPIKYWSSSTKEK